MPQTLHINVMWRDWFTFSKQDRRAILLLSVLIIVVWSLYYTKPLWQRKKPYEAYTTDSLLQYFDNFPKKTERPLITPHPFNPNTTDSLELLSVGLPPYVARNILRYRKAGGVFRKPEDLARIYGLHDTTFIRVRPYIEIPTTDYQKARTIDYQKTSTYDKAPRREHPYADYMRAKYKPGTFVDLNTADTTELMKIPGIGPVRARYIVEYRHALGGYHSIAQVHEAYDLPEHLGDWVHISAPTVKKLHINKVSLTQLHNHPYLTFYQAKAIIELRKREGDIRSIRQLLFLDEFTESDIARLTPYLSFE